MKFVFSLLLSILLNGQSIAAQQDTQKSPAHVVCTILYDNRSVADSIVADHGFSCLVESRGHSCLFDVGRIPGKFLINAWNLGVDLSPIDHVVVSHIHDDHMGGLYDILAVCNKPTLHVPFSYPQMPGEPLGEEADREYQAMLDRYKTLTSDMTREKESVNIGNGFYTTGKIEDQTYEQALIVPTSDGLIVITGCAHPGIVEVVEYAKKLMKQDVFLVAGGFHLIPVESTRVTAIARRLRQLTKYIGPCHCTGDEACRILKDIFKEDYIDVRAGLTLELSDGKLSCPGEDI